MSDLDLQQILSSRFRTSGDADRYTSSLMQNLGLSTKANVARLAIGRSLSLGALKEDGVDSKGLDIPAQSLFSQSDIAVWVGLIITHSKEHGQSISNMDSFRNAVRQHWHRGVILMMEDWQAANGEFDAFMSTLINRRAELPDVAAQPKKSENQKPSSVEKPIDVSAQLIKAMTDIGVVAEVKGVTHGPRVSRYKVFLPDINLLDKLRKGLERLSLVLSLSTVPTLTRGDETKTVFLDIPRPKNTWQSAGYTKLKEWVQSSKTVADQLVVFPGVNVMGQPLSIDLTSAPHLLVGGATGMGKSVCLHALILSLVLQHDPTNLKLALIDPKQVEFSVYQDTGYVYGDGVAVDSTSARQCILDLVDEMEARYQMFATMGVANIAEARRRGAQLPFIVVFIEEMADLILQDKDIESFIVRLAQKARAAGIHLVLATQRPDAKTFSGLVRSNIPVRIALTVQKGTESSIILDETGAENLLGAGDMLVKIPGGQLERAHGVYVTREDIEAALRNRKGRH